jgi:hypothetical protein
MKNSLKLFMLFLLCLLTHTANADNEIRHKSEVDGVGLWYLNPAELVTNRLRFGEDPDFAMFCNGKNKLYIYEIEGRSFDCKTVKWNEKTNSFKDADAADIREMQNNINIAKNDRYSEAGEAQYDVSLRNLKVKSHGIFTVSKQQFLRGDWTMSALTKEEIIKSKNVVLANVKSIKKFKEYSYKSVVGFSDKNIKKLAARDQDGVYAVKIKSKEHELFLLPTLVAFEGVGTDLVSTVVLYKDGTYRYVGHFKGFLLSVGADIDLDGIPELLVVDNNSEGQDFRYIKIFPKVKSLIHYSH